MYILNETESQIDQVRYRNSQLDVKSQTMDYTVRSATPCWTEVSDSGQKWPFVVSICSANRTEPIDVSHLRVWSLEPP